MAESVTTTPALLLLDTVRLSGGSTRGEVKVSSVLKGRYMKGQVPTDDTTNIYHK